MNEEILQLGYALMAELAPSLEAQSAARLSKRLGVRMSSLQRCLSYFGAQKIAGQEGLGLIHAEQDDERLMLSLTELGRAQWLAWQEESGEEDED